jgi:hypothetical protein
MASSRRASFGVASHVGVNLVEVYPDQALTTAVGADFAVSDHLPDGDRVDVDLLGGVSDLDVAATYGLAVDHGQARELVAFARHEKTSTDSISVEAMMLTYASGDPLLFGACRLLPASLQQCGRGRGSCAG